MKWGIQIKKYIEYTHITYIQLALISNKVKQNNYEHERIVKKTK